MKMVVIAFCDLVILWKAMMWAEEQGQIKAGVDPSLIAGSENGKPMFIERLSRRLGVSCGYAMRMEPENFYRHCASRAWDASTQFANNWAWSFGIPVLAAAVTYLGMTEVDDRRWAFLVSLFTGIGAFAFTWCVSFVVYFFRAGPKLYFEERNRADALAERLTPKIGLDVGSTRGVRKEETWDNAANMPGPLIMWVQFAVTPIGDAPLIDCEARLVRVTRLEEGKDEVILEEPVFCVWSDTEKTSIKIPAGITNYANLFSVFLDRKVPLPVTSPRKVGLEKQIRLPGLYRLEVRVSARDVPTRTATFLFIWDGRPDNLALRMEAHPAALAAN